MPNLHTLSDSKIDRESPTFKYNWLTCRMTQQDEISISNLTAILYHGSIGRARNKMEQWLTEILLGQALKMLSMFRRIRRPAQPGGSKTWNFNHFT